MNRIRRVKMAVIGQDNREAINKRFEEYVSSGKVEFFRNAGIDFIAGKREGIYLWDLDGKRLINCHSNGGVFNLGHRNLRVVKALERALAELDIGNHHLVSEARGLLGERLAGICRGDINRVIFGVSGGEAIDMAIKLARAHTRRPKVISALGGYHGHTGLALAAGDEQWREPFGPLAPGFVQVPFGDAEALEREMDVETAAVIFETVPATSGIVIPPDDFFSQVRDLCDRFEAVMIQDEVQTGLGRCGEVWGIDTYGVIPDIIVTGKGLSGGMYPITATLYREHLHPFMHENPFIHISTFGGAEVGCSAALQVLDILEEPGFLEHVLEIASEFERGFDSLRDNYPRILAETRQRGLMMGIKLVDPNLGPLMTRLGFEAGLLLVFAGNDPSVVQVLPPLIIQKQEAKQVLSILDGMLGTLEGMLSN
ncbi:MAG: aspartate aminotransferase family protein [Anaerolineales bacterium]